MTGNNDISDALRALAEAAPQQASEAVQEELLLRFRKRHNVRRLRRYLAAAAGVMALMISLYFARSHGRNASPTVSRATAPDVPSGFIALPYAQSGVPVEQQVIVRVNIPVSELDGLGMTFRPANTRQTVSADVLVAQDGVARAVRFVQ